MVLAPRKAGVAGANSLEAPSRDCLFIGLATQMEWMSIEVNIFGVRNCSSSCLLIWCAVLNNGGGIIKKFIANEE